MDKKGLAIIRYILRQEGYEVRKIREFPKSERRIKNSLKSIIRQNFPLAPKQAKLIDALITRSCLDSTDIRVATDTEDPIALVRDTRRRLKSTQYLRDVIEIESFRQGKRWFYSLKVPPEQK